MTASALYRGWVAHARLRPMRHKLRYPVFMALFDLEELPLLAKRVALFSYNSAGLASFFDSDHGDGSGAPLRAQIEARLLAAGIPFDGGAIGVLCMPRLFGFVFNPISVFFCYARSGALTATIYEVNNTYGERAFYTLPASGGDPIAQECQKNFRVSPFLGMDLHYRFAVRPPQARTSVAIVADDARGPILTASFIGERVALTTRSLLVELLTHPLMTFGVVAAIHWEALQIWLKAKRARRRGNTPAIEEGAKLSAADPARI